MYRDSHCHLRGHPRGFDGDPQTPVLEGQQCAPRPRWAPARSQNSGKEGGRVSVQGGTLATWQDFTFRSTLEPELPTKRDLTFHR